MKPSRIFLLALLAAPACTVAGGGSGGIGAVSCGVPGPPVPSSPEIRLVKSDDEAADRIVLAGLSPDVIAVLRQRPLATEQWAGVLRVTVVQEKTPTEAMPAVAGTYDVADTDVVFKPLFGLDAGRRYLVEFDPAKLPDGVGATMSAIATEVGSPKPTLSPSTAVDHVFPTAELVPENQLRLYVHFSAPMGMKGGLDYIRLLDDAGAEVKDPFLPLDAEFWNGDRTRFTVFFDPGRVKRGILPNKEMGRSLTEGRRYTLVVSREWRDGQGLPLSQDFQRTFRVGPPDDRPLDQRTWRVESPRAGSREPLAVVFPEPLDHGLLLRALGVLSPTGKAVEGRTTIEPGETRWTFTPNDSWKSGDYQLRVLSILEDLAGNRIGRAFEVDQFERADRQPEPEEIKLPFTVGE